MTHFTLNYSQFMNLKWKKLSLERDNLLSAAKYIIALPKDEIKQSRHIYYRRVNQDFT